jgi:hypothetical protein
MISDVSLLKPTPVKVWANLYCINNLHVRYDI